MLKRIGIALAVLLVLAIGVGAWLWNQATALPDWYAEGTPSEYSGAVSERDDASAPPQWIATDREGARLPDAEPVPLVGEGVPEALLDPADSSGPVLESAPPAVVPRKPSQAVPRHELRGFHRRAAQMRKQGVEDPGAEKAVKASRAVYENGHLTMGMVVDLAAISVDKLKPKDRRRYDMAIENFPGLTKRDVWVGIEDDPLSVGGYLQLGPDAKVRVGKLTYSLSGAARRVGMKPEQLRSELNRDLRRMGLVDPNDPPALAEGRRTYDD